MEMRELPVREKMTLQEKRQGNILPLLAHGIRNS